jgi:flavin reductase (DIM6/NTAB) family NADH-FMN oxidoreductase RutF
MGTGYLQEVILTKNHNGCIISLHRFLGGSMTKRIEESVEKLASGGVFLASGSNVMTVGWGYFGVMWGKKVFVAAIRPSRYTNSLVENSKEFTLSVPAPNAFAGELAYVGTKSGRNTDKWEGCGLKKIKAKSVDAYVVDGC